MDYLCDWVLSETWGYSFKVLQCFRLQFPNKFVALSRKTIFQGVEKEKRDEDFISGQIYATNTRLFTWIKCKLHRIENVIIFKLNYRPLGKLSG